MIKALLAMQCIGLLLQQSAGEVSYKTVKDASVVKMLNNLRLLNEFDTNDLSIRVWEMRGKPGSAKRASGEVNSVLYVAVSEFGEYPKQHLFQLTPVYSPQVEAVTKSTEPVIRLSYLDEKDNKHYLNVVVSLKKLIIQKY